MGQTSSKQQEHQQPPASKTGKRSKKGPAHAVLPPGRRTQHGMNDYWKRRTLAESK